MTFTTDDLLMPDREFAVLTAALSSSGNADPIPSVITEELGRVTTVCSPYNIPESWQRRIARGLIVAELYSRAQQPVPERYGERYREAKKDLEDILGGKYSNLLIAGSSPASSSSSPATVERTLTHTADDQAGL